MELFIEFPTKDFSVRGTITPALDSLTEALRAGRKRNQNLSGNVPSIFNNFKICPHLLMQCFNFIGIQFV